MPEHDIGEVLVDLERRGWDSLCEGTGADFYGRMMTDDGLMVLANGEVMDRPTVVGALRRSSPWRSYSIDDVRVVRGGDDTAVLVYQGTGERDGGPPFVETMSSTYVRRGGDWRLAVYQQTPIPNGG